MRRRAFTITELLMVIGIIALLAALLLPALAGASRKSRQTACFNNLHQIGIGFANFALDHEGKYPMQVPERLEGSMEYNRAELVTNTEFSRAFQHFAALSNQMPNAKIFTCPADRRKPAGNYKSFSGTNLSYWVNPNATPHATLSILAGDWNINGSTNLTFDKHVHRRQGSVLFADGRVELTRSFAYTPSEPQIDVAVGSGIPTTGITTMPQGTTPIPTYDPSSTTQPVPQGQGTATLGAKPSSTNQLRTNRTTMTNYTGSSVAGPAAGSSRISQPNTSPEPMPPRASSVPQTRAGGVGSSEASSDEPWDTSGFRLFKFLAVASYLISLLWALLALLALYLKSRLEQRRKQEAARFGEN